MAEFRKSKFDFDLARGIFAWTFVLFYMLIGLAFLV